MPKYSEELKAQALESMKEVGVQKTQELMHISAQTLYKWRSEVGGDAPKVKKERPAKVKKASAKAKAAAKKSVVAEDKATASAPDVKALLVESDGRDEEIKRLEGENAKLRAQNDKLKKALSALMD